MLVSVKGSNVHVVAMTSTWVLLSLSRPSAVNSTKLLKLNSEIVCTNMKLATCSWKLLTVLLYKTVEMLLYLAYRSHTILGIILTFEIVKTF